MAGLSSFVLCVSTVYSMLGCFLTAGSVDNNGALCWPPNQCYFSHISSGQADLITQRCCTLHCVVKYSCHVVRWWQTIYFFYFFVRMIVCTDETVEHQWEEQNDIKLLFPENHNMSSLLYFWVLCLFSTHSYSGTSVHTKGRIELKTNGGSDYESRHVIFGNFHLIYQHNSQLFISKLCFVVVCTEHSLFLWCV